MKLIKLILAACVGCGVFSAQADSYLYWMVGDDKGSGITLDNVTLTDMDYNGARVAYWVDGGGSGYLNLYGVGESGMVKLETPIGATSASDPSAYYASLGSLGNASHFYIELVMGETRVGRSDIIDYAGALAMASTDFAPAQLWTQLAFTAAPAPEPSSGLLLLLGVAGLALRRRKQITA